MSLYSFKFWNDYSPIINSVSFIVFILLLWFWYTAYSLHLIFNIPSVMSIKFPFPNHRQASPPTTRPDQMKREKQLPYWQTYDHHTNNYDLFSNLYSLFVTPKVWEINCNCLYHDLMSVNMAAVSHASFGCAWWWGIW